MEKKFLDESTLTYLRNYIDGQDKVIYKTAANLVSSTHLESLTRPATQPYAQVIPSITTTNEQQNLTIGDGLEIRDGALTTKKYVEANPTETGTTDLAKLKVGSTVYNIPSGGAGGGETSSVFDLTPYFNSETMSLGSGCLSALKDYITNNKDHVAKLDLGGAIYYFTNLYHAAEGMRYSCVVVDPEGVTAFNFDIMESSSDTPMAILSIPNVAANTSDNATEELTKLKIGQTTYNIPSGSGSFTEVYSLVFNNVYLDSSNNRYRICLYVSRSTVDNIFRSYGLNLDDLKNNFSSYVRGESLWKAIPDVISATFDDLYGRAFITDSTVSSLANLSYFKDNIAYFNFGTTSITISSNAYSYNFNNGGATFGYDILKS